MIWNGFLFYMTKNNTTDNEAVLTLFLGCYAENRAILRYRKRLLDGRYLSTEW